MNVARGYAERPSCAIRRKRPKRRANSTGLVTWQKLRGSYKTCLVLESTSTKTIVPLVTKRLSLFTKPSPGTIVHPALIHSVNARQVLVAVSVVEVDITKAETATTHRFLEHSKVVAATTATVTALQRLRFRSFRDEAGIIKANKLLLLPTIKAFKDAGATTRICRVSFKGEEVTIKTCLESSRVEEATTKTYLGNFKAGVVTIPNCLAPTKVAMGITKAKRRTHQYLHHCQHLFQPR
jgi:hypothetical protein